MYNLRQSSGETENNVIKIKYRVTQSFSIYVISKDIGAGVFLLPYEWGYE